VYRQNIAVTIVSSVIFAPVVEELLFRALMYRRMKCVFRGHTAIIVSALFFAVGHASVLQLVYGFIMGIVFAVLYDRRNTILAPVAMHMAANLITILIKL
jgi:membrane protease YdiL (CAAX protease family)